MTPYRCTCPPVEGDDGEMASACLARQLAHEAAQKEVRMKRFKVTYQATLTVVVQADDESYARQYAEADVVRPLTDGTLDHREIWMDTYEIVEAVITVDDATSIEEVQA